MSQESCGCWLSKANCLIGAGSENNTFLLFRQFFLSFVWILKMILSKPPPPTATTTTTGKIIPTNILYSTFKCSNRSHTNSAPFQTPIMKRISSSCRLKLSHSKSFSCLNDLASTSPSAHYQIKHIF